MNQCDHHDAGVSVYACVCACMRVCVACVFALNCPATAIAFCCHCSALRIVNYCAVHSTEMHTPSDKTSFTRNSTHMRSYTCSATHAQKSARCTLICALTHLPTLMRAQSIVLTHTVTHTHHTHRHAQIYLSAARCHLATLPLCCNATTDATGTQVAHM